MGPHFLEEAGPGGGLWHTAARGAIRVVAACLLAAWLAGGLRDAAAAERVTVVEDGAARMALIAGSVPGPVAELQKYLKMICGAELPVARAREGARGVLVGLASDFPWLALEDVEGLGPEGFILRSEGGNLLMVAAGELGVRHAVVTFLHSLGCRWFFPGQTWEVVPQARTIAGTWDERQVPDFGFQRRIWYGFGAYPPCARDWEEWNRHNRMGGPIAVSIGHTWHGLDPEKDFQEHPDWFALVEGERRNSKPCYSHPEVIQRAIQAALAQAAAGRQMISESPPDGLGYCECERCLAVCQGAEPRRSRGVLFATRPDGVVVSVTSETLFNFVNRIAQAVAEQYPDTLIGCYAYSAYSHPPSFDLHPNVYVQTTTAFRRTDMSLEEQIEAFGRKARHVGIREYYSVFQWDWDYPNPGKMTPARLAADLSSFHAKGITAINAEASNNWAARGLGYYVASRLMWDTEADVQAIVRDFYQKAFGPAAPAMERYYVRWYGPSAAALGAEVTREPQEPFEGRTGRPTLEALRAAYADLDEAARLVAGVPGCRERVDHLRMYLHYLVLRRRLDEAAATGDRQRILDAIRDETVFGGRLTYTNMVHSRPLIGKAFLRRFRRFREQLAGVPEAADGGAWRQVGEPPGRDELRQLWEQDRAALGIP